MIAEPLDSTTSKPYFLSLATSEIFCFNFISSSSTSSSSIISTMAAIRTNEKRVNIIAYSHIGALNRSIKSHVTTIGIIGNFVGSCFMLMTFLDFISIYFWLKKSV